jgi:probable phosphoglycerate mutase
MVQLILVRPGCTDYDHQARIQGNLDIPLSEDGKKQAAKAADALRIYAPTALYCSPSNCSEETAECIGKVLELKPKPIERLGNVDLGLWQGLLVDEVRRKQTKVYKQWQEHPETVRPPEGESLSEAAERVDEVLEKLTKKHRSGTIILVVPEPLASVVRQRADGTDLGDLWRAANGANRFDVISLGKSADTVNGNGSAGAANGAQNGQSKSQSVIVYRGVTVKRQ